MPVTVGPTAGSRTGASAGSPTGRWASLAVVALDGPWSRSALAERFAEVLADAGAAERLAGSLVEHLPRMPWTDPARLAAELAGLPGAAAALVPDPSAPAGRRVELTVPPPRWRWPVPAWHTTAELAAALDMTAAELDWFADAGGWLRRSPAPMRHYRYRWVPTPAGVPRLLEAPKPLLAGRQRRVLRHVLEAVPVHPAAHGFVRGRSVLTHTRPHAGRGVVVRLDLEGFFAGIGAARVAGLMRTAGYPAEVARLLAGLTVTAAPAAVLAQAPPPARPELVEVRRRTLGRLASPHLPQGAPSSPALANRVAFGLDRRLAALADRTGLSYTRYADDLAFSGPTGWNPANLIGLARRIVTEEGFRLREDKTRVMPAHRRQRLTGLVVNSAPAVARVEYDALRALLHNCATTGPDAQNRSGVPDFAAHLRGRIAWVASTNPRRAEKLLALYAAIPFPPPPDPG